LCICGKRVFFFVGGGMKFGWMMKYVELEGTPLPLTREKLRRAVDAVDFRGGYIY
jgi:hypothetical protein